MQSVIYNVDIQSIKVVYNEKTPTNSFIINEKGGTHTRVFLNKEQVIQLYSCLGIIHAMYLTEWEEE
jgi:hypothetical protein